MTRRSGIAQVSFASALLVMSLWLLLTSGIAQVWQERDPRFALRWQPGNAEALLRANETETDPAAKQTRARAVLRQRPVDGRAYRQLAQVEQAAGRIASARRLYLIANRRDPRDRIALAWMADDALRRGEFGIAMDRADRLLRMDPFLLKPGYALLAELASTEPFRRALSAVLQRDPPWRSEFIATWAAAPGAVAVPLDVSLSELARSRAGLAPGERDAWAERLIREQRWSAAWTTWARTPATRARRGQVFNGSFESEPHGVFDWALASPAGASVDRVVGNSGAALRVEFYDQRVSFDDVSQLLLLAPGRYRFDARVRLDELRSDGVLAWSLSCKSAERPLLGSGPALRGTAPWRNYSFEFQVPDNCPAQRLALRLQARAPGEQQIAGVAWFDDVRIDPLGPLAPSRPDAPLPAAVSAARRNLVPSTSSDGPFARLVRSTVGRELNEAGNRDADVGVGP